MTMPTTLIWRSGKFIYPRRANVLMHYMPLQEFSLETAQNHSLVVALRMDRREQRSKLLNSYEIAFWRRALLSQSTAEMIHAISSPQGRLIDVGSVNGLNFEELKHLWRNCGETPAYEVVLTTPRACQVFDGLHEGDGVGYNIAPKTSTQALSEADTIFINSSAAMRHPEEHLPDLSPLFEDAPGRRACALRATADTEGGCRTTIIGREVFIPSLIGILTRLRQSDSCWHYQWMADHDSDFFLPEAGTGNVGFLLACQADNINLTGFRPV